MIPGRGAAPARPMRRARTGGVALVALLAANPPLPSAALDPPPADTIAAARARCETTFALLSETATDAGLDRDLAGASPGCRRFLTGGCDATDAGACRDQLVAAHAALRRLGARESDPLRSAVVEHTSGEVSATLSLLAWLGATTGCERLAPPGREAAVARLAADGRSLVIEPLAPLRGGRDYALVLEGPASVANAARPGPVAEAERRHAASARFARAPGGPDPRRVADFLARLERERPSGESVAPIASIELVLPGPVASEDLATLRASFIPERRAPTRGVVAKLRTLAPRRDLAAARERLREHGCRPVRLEPSQAAGAPAPLHGELTRIDPPSDDEDASRLAGTGEEVRFSLWLLPPSRTTTASLGDDTPLVVALDGHRGSARRMLARHGAELAARGLAVASFDLPGHGARADEGDFIVADDPLRLTTGIRRSVLDLLAVAHSARKCGFLLPDGRLYRPGSVRLLGYSLGAMVGVIARALEPELGTTVLLAPGGDLFSWLMLRLGHALGARYVSCLGGADHGKSCFPEGVCEPPGRCAVDPFLRALHETLERPYRQAVASVEPLSFARERTGVASDARLLLITGGADGTLPPNLASRLADAYGMQVVAPQRRRGPNAVLVQWPGLGHDLQERAEVRRQAHEFLASDGRLPADVKREPAAAVPSPGIAGPTSRARLSPSDPSCTLGARAPCPASPHRS